MKYGDQLGLAKTITTDKENCSINISLDIVIYPDEGSSIDGTTMNSLAQSMKQSIESNWNGKKKGCCNVHVTANVTPQKRKSKWLYRAANRDENNIAITSDPKYVSVVQGIGGRYGTWGRHADPWVYAHETGHLMGIGDDYIELKGENGERETKPKEGHEGHMMAEERGQVDQHEIDDILKDTECPCDE